MGVSRKLAPLSRGENSISDVGFQWSSQRYSLEELSARFRLPVVVQCVVESCQVLTSSFTFDLSQPLVLHSSRCRRKIKARSLAPSRSLDPPSEVGPPLVIPEDYDGWFVAGGDGAKPPCYTKVVELAEVAASRVLVAKRHLALVQIGSSAGVTYTERHLEPGEVLAVMGQCKGELTLPASSPFRRSRRFLRCVDERGDSLLLCLQQRGAFYQVAPRVARDDASAVVSPKQLIASRDQFPLQVRHVMGEPPVMLRNSFPRLLRLDSVFSERSMLAAPLVASRSRPRPLEVAVRSRLLFRMALNHGQLLRTREGVRALDACESGGGAYFSAIKVAFTLRPEVSPLDDLDLSLYETGHRRRPAVASSESPRPHVSRRLPLELQGCGSLDSLRGEREDSQRQDLEEAGRPATRRAREYHGEPLSGSDSDSDEGQVINGDDDDDDLDDDQASAACDVDAQSEFEIDWEPERLEGQNSSSPINGSLAGDCEQGPWEQRLAADSVNSVRETFSGTNDHSTIRLTNSEPHIRRDMANHSMTSGAKVHRQFQISFENDAPPQTNGDAHDILQERREVLKDLEEEQAEEQEEQEKEENEEQEEEEEGEKEKQKEEQEGEKADEHGEGREEEEQEEDLLREEDNDQVEVDEALGILETLDLDDDDNDFLQEETQQEEEQEKQRYEEKEEKEKEGVRELREEEKEEEEITATIEEMVMAVNETEVLVVQEDEEEDIGWRQGQDGDDDDDRVQEHIEGQEGGLPKDKGIETQWKTLWIQSSGIPPLPKPRPPRRPPPPSRRLPPSPNPDIQAGPPPLPPRAPCSPTVSPKPSQILDILVLNEDFTTPVEV